MRYDDTSQTGAVKSLRVVPVKKHLLLRRNRYPIGQGERECVRTRRLRDADLKVCIQLYDFCVFQEEVYQMIILLIIRGTPAPSFEDTL